MLTKISCKPSIPLVMTSLVLTADPAQRMIEIRRGVDELAEAGYPVHQIEQTRFWMHVRRIFPGWIVFPIREIGIYRVEFDSEYPEKALKRMIFHTDPVDPYVAVMMAEEASTLYYGSFGEIRPRIPELEAAYHLAGG